MNKINLSFLLIFATVYVGCTKKNDSSASSTTTPPVVNSNATIYGSLGAQRILYANSITGIPDTTYSAFAFFYNKAVSDWSFTDPSVTTFAGTVTINSTVLQFFDYVYIDSTGILNLKSGDNWQVTGGGGIPAFSFTSILDFPSYTGYASLPDTIYKSKNNVISFNGITGADSVNVTIDDMSGIHASTSARLSAQATDVTFLSTYLSGFFTTSSGMLSIVLYKFSPVKTFSGKNFVFVRAVHFNKQVVIK